MSAPSVPPDGARVRVVLRGGKTLFGDMIPARLQSGRWPVKPWGIDNQTWCIDPAEVDVVEVVDLAPEEVRAISARQRIELDPKGMPAKRARMITAVHASTKENGR